MGLYVKKGDSLVVIANNNTVDVDTFTGATTTSVGTSGIVPAPAIADVDKFLCGDGKWEAVPTASPATETSDGLMSKEDKIKLDYMPGVVTSATEPASSNEGDFWYQTY